MAKMIGNLADQCPWGCCRQTGPRGRKAELRTLKRREQRETMKEEMKNAD
jgi:hypothetical protein